MPSSLFVHSSARNFPARLAVCRSRGGVYVTCMQKGYANWWPHANPRPPAWVSVQRRCTNRRRVEGERGLPRLCAKWTSEGQTWRWHHPPSDLHAGRHTTRDARKPGSHAPPPPSLSTGAAREWEAAQARKRCPVPRVCTKGASEPGHAPNPEAVSHPLSALRAKGAHKREGAGTGGGHVGPRRMRCALLCSLGFALYRLRQKKKKSIVYVI